MFISIFNAAPQNSQDRGGDTSHYAMEYRMTRKVYGHAQL